jgi:CBS domain-containing protein
MTVADIYAKGRGSETISAGMSIRDFLDKVTQTADAFFVVRRSRDNKLVGIVSLSNVRSVVTEGEFLDAIVVGDAMWPVICVKPTLTLAECLDVFVDSGYGHLVVVDPDDPDVVLGMIAHAQILETYNAEIVRRQLDDDPTVPAVPAVPAEEE